MLTAWLTFHVLKEPKVSPTRSSTMIALKGILLLLVVERFYPIDFKMLSVLVFGASFVGMSSHKIVSDLETLCSGALFGILFIALTPKISQFGGALGFSAFLSVGTFRILFSLAAKYGTDKADKEAKTGES